MIIKFITKQYFSKKIIKNIIVCVYNIIKHEKIINDTAFKFLQKKDLAFLPISNKETSIVYSVIILNQKEENIEQLIKEKILNIKLKI